MRNQIRRFNQALLMLGFIVAGYSLQAQQYFTVTVNQAPALSADAGQDQTITDCVGDSTTLGGSPAANGGTPAYNYSWSPTSGLAAPGSGNTGAKPASSTVYILTVTDSMNCSALDTVFVTVDTCVGIPDWQLPLEVTVYPNPTDGKFSVRINGESLETVNLNILDQRGRLILEEDLGQANGKLEKDFSLDGFSKGVYYLRFDVGGQKLARRLILR